MDETKTYTVAVGEVFDHGITLYGVFKSSKEAIEYAEREWKGYGWTVVEINAPL